MLLIVAVLCKFISMKQYYNAVLETFTTLPPDQQQYHSCYQTQTIINLPFNNTLLFSLHLQSIIQQQKEFNFSLKNNQNAQESGSNQLQIYTKMRIGYKKPIVALALLFVLLCNVSCQQTPDPTPPAENNQTQQQTVKNETEPVPVPVPQPQPTPTPTPQPQPKPQQPKPQQPKPLDYTPIQLDTPYPQQLTKDTSFSRKFRLTIPEQKVTKLNESKWFLFVDVETTEEFEWEKTKIQLFTIGAEGNEKPLKECDTVSGLDSCFLTSSNFDYKTETIQARVTCEEYCKFNISAEVSAKYKLEPDKVLQLDFENTAYSKLFSLDTSQLFDFKRLQIILKPKGFLSFNAPIRLYANKGEAIPTREKHDYAGIHLWDDGLGIFINYPDGSGTFTILIEGPEKNVLTLETKVIYESKPITTFRYEPSFAFLQSQQRQLFEIPVNKSEHTFIKLTTLTGSIQMTNVKDESMKDMETEFTPLSRSYGQLEYKFEPTFFEENKDSNVTDKMYIEIKANKDSTFIFESYTNNEELSYLVPEVNRYSDLEKGGVDLYYMRLFELQENIDNDKNPKSSRIEVMTTTYDYIELGTRFFLCKADDVKECQPSAQEIKKLSEVPASNDTAPASIDNEKRKQIKNMTKDMSVPGVRYFDIEVSYSDFVKKDELYHAYIIIVLINPKPDEEILYTLQYINLGETYFLKEKELKRDRLSIDQIKYYTFVNNDKDVKSVKIHSIEISGEILMVGYRQDPRYNEVQGKEVYEYHGSVTFLNVQPGQQLFIEVQGIENAYYSLYLQLIRESESNPDDKGNNNEGYNEIIIQENIQYDFFIKPKEKLIVQMHSTVTEYDLVIESHLPLDLCMTENLDKSPFSPNCEIAETLTKNERMGIKMDKGLIGNMGVTNNNDKSVQFKIKMSPKNQPEPECKQSCAGMMNKFSLQVPSTNTDKSTNQTASDQTISNQTASNETIHNETASNQTASNQTASNQTTPVPTPTPTPTPIPQCYKLNLNRRQNVEIMVELDNMLYDNTTITWQLNNKEKEIMMTSRHLIWKKELVKVCGESQKDLCELLITIESPFATDGILLVQYLDRDLILLDGIAQPSFTDQKSLQAKHFRYQLINLANTTILLQNKAGYYHFYGNVMPRTQFMKSQNRTSLYPTEENHLFKSENPFYYVFQAYVVTQEELRNTTCKQECVLLISVLPGKNGNSAEEMGRFVIEVSQEDRYLKENQPIMGYLERGSIAFYEYYNPNKGTIYIELNNQNMNCAKIFVKKGNETRATPSSYDKMTEKENSLIYEDAEAGPYAIAVEANHFGCSYTISAVSSVVRIEKLKRGVFSDKTLQQNETYHFLYEHYRNESFKILTLNKVGQLVIKLKVLYGKDLNVLLSANTSETLAEHLTSITYQATNIDFLKVHHKKDIFFCTNCTYLISVTANKYTETSVIIPSKDVEIPIITDALIKDQVKANEVMKYRIFTSNIAQYQLYVQYGQINLTIIESISDKVVLNKVYTQTKQPIYEKFNSSSSSDNTTDNKFGYGYDFIHYSIITIEGIANSSFYSFQLLSTDDQKKQGNVKYGIPEYFFLQPNGNKCFKGTIDDDSEEFILSFDDSTLEAVKNLAIECKVNDKVVEYKTTYGVSEMTLDINNLKLSEPAVYEICLKSNETLSLMFIQSAHIMMIPSDTSILLTHPTNLTFGCKGTTILEVDECSTRSIISISSTFNDLHTSDSEIQQVHRANNLVEFSHWGPVYVHLETEGTRLRWRNKNVYKEEGMGYDRFTAGTAHAFKQGDNIKIEASPIEQIDKYAKNTTVRIDSVTYKVILGRYEHELLNSMNCNEKDVTKWEYQTESLNQSAIATFPINEEMKQKFSELRFFLAGVIGNLNIEVNGKIENYRFVYPMVEIQREVFYGGDVKPVDNSGNISREDTNTNKNNSDQSLSYLLGAVGVILLILASVCIYKKWIKKWLRSRRQRLSDQGSASFKYTEFASMQD